MASAHQDILAVLRRAGLLDLDKVPAIEPLTGGVSSAIYKVTLDGGPVCVKRALKKLRVKKDWFAPVERSLYEGRWIHEARLVDPDLAPELLYSDEAAGCNVMAFIDAPQWKERLSNGEGKAEEAGSLGRKLADLHGATVLRPEIAERFRSEAIFRAIRLEPYFLAAAANHKDVAQVLQRLVRQTEAVRLSLVHGDVSPKNILISDKGPVILDAECAHYGDPAFDLAFCLTHLLLKAVWKPAFRVLYQSSYEAMVEAYMERVFWEPRLQFERRAASLVPALLLARIDGKSPVEYITSAPEKKMVRDTARGLLVTPPSGTSDLLDAFYAELGD